MRYLHASAFLLLAAACGNNKILVERVSPAPATVLIKDVRVLDVVTGSIAEHRDVLLQGDRISSIAPSAAGATAEKIIEGAGLTLLPGLVDVHGHIGSNPEPLWNQGTPNVELNLQRFVYAGVTTVFDPGGMDDDAFEKRAAIESGKLLGPRLFSAGPIFTAVGGHPVPLLENGLPPIIEGWVIGHMTRQIASEEEGRRAVKTLLESKPDFVKIAVDRIPESAPALDRKIAKAIVDEARAGGVRAVAHIGTTTNAIDAAEAGVSAWIHGVYKNRIADGDLDRLLAYKIPMAPTLVVFDNYGMLGHGPRVPTALEKEMVDANLLTGYDAIPADYQPEPGMREMVDVMYAERQNALDNVKRLHDKGMIIMAGSDAQSGVFHGAGLHRELMLLAKAGLSPIEVIRAATLYPARFLKKTEDPEFGIVAAGKIADLILVEGDPLAKLESISALREVIVRGVPIKRHTWSEAR